MKNDMFELASHKNLDIAMVVVVLVSFCLCGADFFFHPENKNEKDSWEFYRIIGTFLPFSFSFSWAVWSGLIICLFTSINLVAGWSELG